MSRAPSASKPRVVAIVMGVSGSGKSTVGAGIAEAMRIDFLDGDSLHDAAAVEKMREGIALDDGDRWPWLDRIGARLADAAASPRGIVIACSALKRRYRDRLRAAAPGVRFVFLDGDAALLDERLRARAGHYMPASLLRSQLEALEVPGASEPDVWRTTIDTAPAAIVAQATAFLGATPA